MGKHSKNSAALHYYTAYERTRDSKVAGYGTQVMRLGKDSQRHWDSCWLTLQHPRDPVVTQHGYLYDREAILTVLLNQKAEMAKLKQLYDESIRKQESERRAIEEAVGRDKIAEFRRLESAVSTSASTGSSGPSEASQGSFWVPHNTPTVSTGSTAPVARPDQTTTCPFSGKKLRVKDLISVKFTPVNGDAASTATSKHRWMCPITFETLTDSTPVAVLRPSGRVVSADAVKHTVRKDMCDPIDGTKLTDADIIMLQKGASSFAASGNKLEAKKYEPAMQ